MWAKFKLIAVAIGGFFMFMLGGLAGKNKRLKSQVKAGQQQQERIEEALDKNSKLDEDNVKDALNNHFSK